MTMPRTSGTNGGCGGGGNTSFKNLPNDASSAKKKKTKLEKICELESALKIAKEENRRLHRELKRAQQRDDAASVMSGNSASLFGDDARSIRSGVSTNEDKLKDALRAFKRVTVQQELSLTTLRSKAQQRRRELDHKDNVIQKLSEEVQSLKKAYDRMRKRYEEEDITDVGRLQARVADLELRLAMEDTRNEEQTKRLAESNDNISSLKDQLEKVRGRMQKVPSSKSLKSAESSTTAASAFEDMAKLKRELANKTEQIAHLEYELEVAKDEIHELKQRQRRPFPAAAADAFPMTSTDHMEDFFSDDEEDDDFWGN